MQNYFTILHFTILHFIFLVISNFIGLKSIT